MLFRSPATNTPATNTPTVDPSLANDPLHQALVKAYQSTYGNDYSDQVNSEWFNVKSTDPDLYKHAWQTGLVFATDPKGAYDYLDADGYLVSTGGGDGVIPTGGSRLGKIGNLVVPTSINYDGNPDNFIANQSNLKYQDAFAVPYKSPPSRMSETTLENDPLHQALVKAYQSVHGNDYSDQVNSEWFNVKSTDPYLITYDYWHTNNLYIPIPGGGLTLPVPEYSGSLNSFREVQPSINFQNVHFEPSQTSEDGDFWSSLLPIVAIVASIVMPALAGALGEFVATSAFEAAGMTSVAAAEAAAELGATALTAIGSGTISATITAANGGSLEEVATSAVTAGAATYAGAIVSQAVSSTVNSSLASSVTNGTISQATSSTISNAVASATSSVAKSLIRNGELDSTTVLNAFESAGAGAEIGRAHV